MVGVGAWKRRTNEENTEMTSTNGDNMKFPLPPTVRLFIDRLLLPVCGTKRLKLDLHRQGFEIN